MESLTLTLTQTLSPSPSPEPNPHQVRAVDPVRVAVLLHGPTGTLRHTLPSIQSNLLAPLMKMAHGATVDVFAHLVDTHGLADPAHPEAKTPYLPPAEAEPLAQLGPCRYRLAKAAELDAKYNLSSLVNLHAAEGAAPGSTALAAAGSSALGGDEPEPRP